MKLANKGGCKQAVVPWSQMTSGRRWPKVLNSNSAQNPSPAHSYLLLLCTSLSEEKDKMLQRDRQRAQSRGSKYLLQVPLSMCNLGQAQGQGYHVGKTHLHQDMYVLRAPSKHGPSVGQVIAIVQRRRVAFVMTSPGREQHSQQIQSFELRLTWFESSHFMYVEKAGKKLILLKIGNRMNFFFPPTFVIVSCCKHEMGWNRPGATVLQGHSPTSVV